MVNRLPSACVIVPTYRRPQHVKQCLERLTRQTVAPTEILVVDSSPDDLTRKVVESYDSIGYLRNERGLGTTATSRAIGVEATTSEVIAFVDDDAFAETDWLEQLLQRYADSEVAAVGGRARNGQPGEEREGLGEIGRLLPDGRLTGYFAADPGRDVDVDHMLGANMSWRRSVARELGGIRDYYPGTCLREETDMSLRMRCAGYRVVFTPDAVVDHVAGPYARGRRFDLRYTYYGQRNHMVLLARTLGPGSPYFRRYWRTALREIRDDLRYGAQSLVGSGRSTAVASSARPGGWHLTRHREAGRPAQWRHASCQVAAHRARTLLVAPTVKS